LVSDFYYPLQEGNSWTYLVTAGPALDTQTVTIAKIQKTGGDTTLVSFLTRQGQDSGGVAIVLTGKGFDQLYHSMGSSARLGEVMPAETARVGAVWSRHMEESGEELGTWDAWFSQVYKITALAGDTMVVKEEDCVIFASNPEPQCGESTREYVRGIGMTEERRQGLYGGTETSRILLFYSVGGKQYRFGN